MIDLAGSIEIKRSILSRINKVIQQTFTIATKSYRIIPYKKKSLISNIIAKKKLNTIADKIVNAVKKIKYCKSHKIECYS